MRRKLIYSLLTMFVLFFAGSTITMAYLYKTTTNLESVINLHRVEIIRQDLVINVQTVQSHLYSFGSAFGQELDVIVENVLEMDASATRCLGCHHNKEITERLTEVRSLVDQYQNSLSLLVTTTANTERVERLRMVAIGIGTTLLGKTQEMAFIAGEKLKDKTVASIDEINNSRIILLITLAVSLFAAIAVAVGLTRQVTEPIDELVDATRRIKGGELGYETPYRAKAEFGELIASFNDMSRSLSDNRQRLEKHLNNLSNLYSVTLTFHATNNEAEIIEAVAYGVANLIGAEQCGLMLPDGDTFIHRTPAVGVDRLSATTLRASRADIAAMMAPANRRALIVNGNHQGAPFGEADRKLHVRNLMLVWVKHKGEMKGIIRVANKRRGDFTSEDAQALAILANNVSVALENARLYDDLRRRMQELQSAQEQLVQAAKLVAIGELASQVAHEINNPLTSVLGYAELIKEDYTDEGLISDISVIESETLRAKEIVHQLLEFSRKRALNVIEIDVNRLLDEVLDLVMLQIKTSGVKIARQYENVPAIEGDPNQLKQVFINLINNAVFAVNNKGTVKIGTYLRHGSVHIDVADDGEGIPKELQERIFEPFFSTKNEKGTGIGLSVSYKIVQGHNGRIAFESEPGVGTKFTVVLPITRTTARGNGAAMGKETEDV